MKKTLFFITLLISFSCSKANEDNSELFLGKWTYTSPTEKGMFDIRYTYKYIIEIKRQDNESLKVNAVKTTLEHRTDDEISSYIIYKKTSTTYVSDDSKYTYALNMETGNIEINGKEYKKEVKL